ncbi:GSCOCG00012298001-RA-CDS [Cotesia congregata]|nr:GSCOCG00012298001-RA-CDS [Cotesia congregata]
MLILVFSATVKQECISTKSHLEFDPTLPMLQRPDIEEADVKMMIHIAQAASENVKKVLLLSTDTDVLVLSLNYWSMFKSYGL